MQHDSKLEQYYEQGRSWYYDKYQAQQIAAKRWMLAFIMQSLVTLSLVVALIILLPLKTLVPIPIKINELNHTIKVEKPNVAATVVNEAMVKGDLIRFVRNYESYSYHDIGYRSRQIGITSVKDIYKRYREQQTNNEGLTKILGENGRRVVAVHDVIFLNRQDAAVNNNLAKIDFTTTTINGNNNKKEYWVATISWEYQGLPQDESIAWDNWSGFIVTHYRIDKRIL